MQRHHVDAHADGGVGIIREVPDAIPAAVQPVIARAAAQPIRAAITRQRVVARATNQQVRTGAADQHIISVAAVDGVGAQAHRHAVVSAHRENLHVAGSRDAVVERRANQPLELQKLVHVILRARTSHRAVHASLDGARGSRVINRVASSAALERVAIRAADDGVVALAAVHQQRH